MRHVSVPKPPGRATRRQGNADLWSAQPAEGGRREGPRVGGASRSGPGVQRCADGGGPCFSLRFAQRCRPPPGGLAGGRAGPAHPPGMKMQFPGRRQSRPHATMQSDAQARERRPLGSPPGGARHSPPQAGGGKDPELGGLSRSGPGVQRCADGGGPRLSLRFAQRCRPPPGGLAGGRAGPAHPPGMKMQFPGRRQSRCPSHQAERRAGKGTPTSGRQPAAGGRREGPRVGRLPGRDPVFSVVRTVGVHAFCCASRSGAGPHREDWPEVGPGLHTPPA